MTPAEKILWRELRGRKAGCTFYRQAVIRGWIVDFWCPWARVVIEVDGPIHQRQSLQDAYRDAALRQIGILTLRYSNAEVLSNVEHVLERILEVLIFRKQLGR